jgi:hypothetical protein
MGRSYVIDMTARATIPVLAVSLMLALPAWGQSVIPGTVGTVPPPARPAPLSSEQLNLPTPGVAPPLRSSLTPLGKAPRSRRAHVRTARQRQPQPVPGFSNLPPPPAGQAGSSFSDKAAGCVQYGTSMGIGARDIGAYTRSCANTR